jgi:hypothetical protein
MPGHYLEICHDLLLPNPYLLTIQDHLSISVEITLLKVLSQGEENGKLSGTEKKWKKFA